MSLNIIHIITDQHRWDSLRCYGNPIVKTPNLDNLAKEGVRFNSAFTPSSLCGPARASLYTGLFPSAHGIIDNPEPSIRKQQSVDIFPEVKKLPEYLPSYDYLHYGKWHVEASKMPSDYGATGHDFDGYGFPGSGLYKNFKYAQGPTKSNRYSEWLWENGFEIPSVTESFFGENENLQIQELCAKLSGPHQAALPFFLVDELKNGLEARKSTQTPFFSSLHFWGPHTPCVVPEPYYSMYNPKDIPVDPAFEAGLAGKPTHMKHISKMWGVYDLDWSKWQKIIARYYGYITMIDDAIGGLIDFLKTEGLYDNTLIIFSADHGDAMGAHKLIEKGEFMYDTCYRIPMIARHPYNSNPGSVCDDFVYLHDLCPTTIEAATGISPDMKGQSQSILGLMRGDNNISSGRDHVYGELTSHFVQYPQRMFRTKTHKLIFNACSNGELYDLASDPYEINNLIDSPHNQSIKKELIAGLIKQMTSLNDPLVNWLKRVQGFY